MIYDISPAITHNLKVWPGDTPPMREILAEIESGNNITLSTLHSTVHLGAHTDAPNHYVANSPSIGDRSLHYYLGKCQVIDVNVSRNSPIFPELIQVPIQAERVLFRTNTFPDPEYFNEDFAALSPELIEFLSEKNVILVGIDTPSVDLFHAKQLVTHHRIHEKNMAILEGIVLTGVPEGLYELIALPLKLMGFDASPVRAILRK
jgi:arylformamidase